MKREYTVEYYNYLTKSMSRKTAFFHPYNITENTSPSPKATVLS